MYAYGWVWYFLKCLEYSKAAFLEFNVTLLVELIVSNILKPLIYKNFSGSDGLFKIHCTRQNKILA